MKMNQPLYHLHLLFVKYELSLSLSLGGVFTLVCWETFPQWTCPPQSWVRGSVCPSVWQLQPCREWHIPTERRPLPEVRHQQLHIFDITCNYYKQPHGGVISPSYILHYLLLPITLYYPLTVMNNIYHSMSLYTVVLCGHSMEAHFCPTKKIIIMIYKIIIY